MKFASWGSELRDALIALYEVSLSWESWWIYSIIINLLIIKVPGDTMAGKPASADIVPRHLWEASIIHVQEVRFSARELTLLQSFRFLYSF